MPLLDLRVRSVLILVPHPVMLVVIRSLLKNYLPLMANAHPLKVFHIYAHAIINMSGVHARSVLMQPLLVFLPEVLVLTLLYGESLNWVLTDV